MTRTNLIRVTGLWLTALLVTYSSAFGQLVVYQNSAGTESYASVGAGTPGTAGDLVLLTGTVNTLSEFTVGLRGDTGGAQATADLSLYFYTPVTGTAVGSQLGQTVTQTSVPIPDGPFSVTFSGLSVTVPNAVIWAVSIANLSGAGNPTLSWTYSDPPTVGSSDNTFAYLNIPGAGLLGIPPSTNGGVPDNLTATITAVPEPSSYAAAFGVACLAMALQRGFSRRAKKLPGVNHPIT